MKSIFCAALILLGTFAAFAQERTISKEEFDGVVKQPNKLAPYVWRDKSYRTILITEVRSEGKMPVNDSSKGIIEFVPGVGSRLLNESQTGSKITKTERISIGDKTYKRNGDEAWSVEAKSQAKPPEANDQASTWKLIDRQTEYKYLGTEMLNNKITKVYLTVEKTKAVNSSNNQESIATITTKYWFSEDGINLKEDRMHESQTGTGNSYLRLIKAWELDPSIKIEAPVLN